MPPRAKRALAAALPTVAALESERVVESAMIGGLEGAARNGREMLSWQPAIISPDMQTLPTKDLNDQRGVDIVRNDGNALGVVHTYRDSIVGNQYRLISTPDWKTLGATPEWAEEFRQVIESEFNLLADSTECWFDAAGKMTFTDIIRLGVCGFVMTGEVLQTVEWLTDPSRPFKTAIQSISPTRLSNPNFMVNSETLRHGVVLNGYGRPTSYWIQLTFPHDYTYTWDMLKWKEVPAAKPWGRAQVIHIMEALQPGQTRGVSDMVSVLKQMKMTKQFQDVTLQNAVVNATYAAAIESELPSEVVFASMGAGGQGMMGMLNEYMTALTQYTGASKNIALDGVKMPHLFPGTKLNMQPAGTPGGVGTGYEQSLHRHIAGALGVSYEEFSRDYSQTNYSSARASGANTKRFMLGKKKTVADKNATSIYKLWLEERINSGRPLPLPPGKDIGMFYDPVMREALCKCKWIGASSGQIDEMKETQAAILRINSGLSTYEAECANLGEDFREVFAQRQREEQMKKDMNLVFATDAAKPGLTVGQVNVDPRTTDGGGQQNTTPKKGAKQ